MRKYLIAAVLIFVTLSVCISLTMSPDYKETRIEMMAKIDSISSYQPYSVTPETKYIYYTRYGNLSDTHKRYNVGDSILITVILISK